MKTALSIIHMGEVVAWGGTEGPSQLTPLRSEALIRTQQWDFRRRMEKRQQPSVQSTMWRHEVHCEKGRGQG